MPGFSNPVITEVVKWLFIVSRGFTLCNFCAKSEGVVLQDFFLNRKNDNNLTFHGAQNVLKVKRPFALRLHVMISFVTMWSTQAALNMCRISSSVMFLHQCNSSDDFIHTSLSGSLNSAELTRRKSKVLCLSKCSYFSTTENRSTYSVQFEYS